jgi:hypothetical protein
MSDVRQANLGDHVIFTDPKGNDHHALVQTVWTNPTINVLFVSSDENRRDSYGRQVEHATSVPHVSCVTVHGFYWRHPDEQKNEYVPPQQV